jgi:hypothetical protein
VGAQPKTEVALKAQAEPLVLALVAESSVETLVALALAESWVEMNCSAREKIRLSETVFLLAETAFAAAVEAVAYLVATILAADKPAGEAAGERLADRNRNCRRWENWGKKVLVLSGKMVGEPVPVR